MTTIKLGTILPALQAGDKIRWKSHEYTLNQHGCWEVDGVTMVLAPDGPIELISPRLVKREPGERVAKCDWVIGGIGFGEVPWVIRIDSENVSDGSSFKLLRSPTYPRRATRADVRVGMVVEFLESMNPKPMRVTQVEGDDIRVEGGGLFVLEEGMRDAPVLIHSEPPAETLPRLVKGAELRVGDRVRYVECEGFGATQAIGANRALGGHGTVTHRLSWGWGMNAANGKSSARVAPDKFTMELISRADEQPNSSLAFDLAGTRIDNADAATVTVAQPDPLREAWRFLCDGFPWELVAGIHAQRGWGPKRHLQNGTAWARMQANVAFEAALKTGHGHKEHTLVVLQPTNPDRPIELYCEALNAAAYQAKLEELWPKPKAERKPAPKCNACEAELFGKWVKSERCGDCWLVQSEWDTRQRRAAMARRVAKLAAKPETATNPYHEWRGWMTPGLEA